MSNPSKPPLLSSSPFLIKVLFALFFGPLSLYLVVLIKYQPSFWWLAPVIFVGALALARSVWKHAGLPKERVSLRQWLTDLFFLLFILFLFAELLLPTLAIR